MLSLSSRRVILGCHPEVCYLCRLDLENCPFLIHSLAKFCFGFNLCRLEPVIIELERQRAPVIVISHQVTIPSFSYLRSRRLLIDNLKLFSFGLFLQAVLRALYAYFADRPLEEIPHIEVTILLVCDRFPYGLFFDVRSKGWAICGLWMWSSSRHVRIRWISGLVNSKANHWPAYWEIHEVGSVHLMAQ